MITVGLMAGGYVQREALPDIDGDVLEARILMPQGTPLSRTEAEVPDACPRRCDTFDAALSPRQPGGAALVQSVQTFSTERDRGKTGPHVATVSADLLGAETRTVTLDELTARGGGDRRRARRHRRSPERTGHGAAGARRRDPPDGRRRWTICTRRGTPAGRAGKLCRGLNAMHDLRPGRPELRLTLAEGATGLGLTAADVAAQVGTAFLGGIVTTVQAGDISHEIEIEQTPADRDSRDDLAAFEVLLPDGARIPLTTVARIEEARGWGRIAHVDGHRTLTVAADVDGRAGNADAIVGALAEGALPAIVRDYPGMSYAIEGQNANSAETMGSILRGFLIGLVGIYVVLSFQFRSYVEPAVVMLTIPLALVGVVLGHMAMGYNISMPSIMGAASLAGIVVNNAILLVQVIKRRTAEGADRATAAGLASRERFRPIVVSVSTTLMGLVPLLLETSTQAQTVKPLVISVVFGLLSATVLVLIVLPALYAILGDLRREEDRATP